MEKYGRLTPEIVEKIRAAAPGLVLTGGEISEDYSHDEMEIYGSRMPDLVVMASGTQEIADVMRICNDYRIPVTTS